MKAKINYLLHIINLLVRLAITQILYRVRFGRIGGKTVLFGQFSSIMSPECMFIGNNVRILKNARLDCVTSWMGSEFRPSFTVGDNVNIGQNFFISCASNISIGDGVLISDNVAIIDTNHTYKKGLSCSNASISTQGITIEKNVVIYRNATILSGSYIEEGAIIGANSVVKGRVPKNSLTAGSPAKQIDKDMYSD